MPNYLFLNEDSGEIQEIFFKFSDVPSIGTYIEYEGQKLRRQATIPCASSNTITLDPFSSKDFNRLTSKGGTMGEMFDLSAEFSQKRAEKDGYDPIKLAKEQKAEKEGKIVVKSETAKVNESKRGFSKLGVNLKIGNK